MRWTAEGRAGNSDKIRIPASGATPPPADYYRRPMARTVWFECKPRQIFVPKGLRCHKESFDGLTVSEFRRRSSVRPYSLRMEARVGTRAELGQLFGSALDLARDLDLVWTYVGGRPLFPVILTVELAKAPGGWKTNASEIRPRLPVGGTGLSANVRLVGGRLSWMTLPFMPLKPALQAVRAYRASDEVTRLLMDLHTRALKSPGSDTGLFLMAKALELVRKVLPGPHDPDREKALDEDVRSRLRRPFAWLWKIANSRMDVRHVVERHPAKLRLHPKLTTEERRDFLHDVDLVLRAVISKKLGVDLAIVERE